jgi:AhpD family alkylhydroperoxidase
MGSVIDRKVSDVHQDMAEMFGEVPSWVAGLPDSVLPGFWSLMKEFQLADTKIPCKYKELIGLAVAGATRCRYCALFHTEAARLNGATDEEISEAAAMAGFTMCASTILNAAQIDYDQFRLETLSAIEYVKGQVAQQAGGRKDVSPINRPSAAHH